MKKSLDKVASKGLRSFIKQNPDFDLNKFDYFDRDAIEKMDWKGIKREKVLDELKLHRRMLNISANADIGEKLIKSGFTSAHKIASMSKSHFIKESKTIFNGDIKEAAEIHQRATNIKGLTMHLWANVKDNAASPYFKSMRVNHVSDEIANFFQGLPSYQDIFGSLDYCECEHCKSIFSPAAYLVDLMRITDEYITTPNKDTIPPELTIDKRRPKLATLPLTCANTNDLLPYIEIVNEVLAARVMEELDTADPFKSIATEVYPFNLPINLPLQQIRFYLANLKTDLAQIYSKFIPVKTSGKVQVGTQSTITLSSSASNEKNIYNDMEVVITAGPGSGQERTIISYDSNTKIATISPNWATIPDTSSQYLITGERDIALAYLNISYEENQIYTTSTTDPVKLSRYYGLDISGPDLGGLKFEDNFIYQTGMTRNELHALLYENLDQNEIDKNIAHQFYINQVLANQDYLKITVDSADPNRNIIDKLNDATLDRLNRFIRLARKLKWSSADLNWVLSSIAATDIDENAIESIASIAKLKEKTGLPLDLLTSFWSDMKTIGVGKQEAPEDLFDQVYNNKTLLKGRPPYHPLYPDNPTYHDEVQSWQINKQLEIEPTFGKGRLAAALQLSGTALTDIASALWGKDATVELNVPNLSLLYRISKLLSLLNLTIEQFQTILSFIGIEKITKISSHQLIELIDMVDWIRQSGFTVAELNFIINGTESLTAPVNMIKHDNKEFMKSLWTLAVNILINSLSFTHETISAEESKEIFRLLIEKELLYSVKESYKTILDIDIDAAIVSIEATTDNLNFLKTDPNLKLTDDEVAFVHETLLTVFSSQGQFISQQFAGYFQLSAGAATGIGYFFSKVVGTIDVYLKLLLIPINDNTQWDNINLLFKSIARTNVIVKKLLLNEAELESVADNPQAYNLSSFPPSDIYNIKLTIQDVESLYTFKQLIRAFNDKNDNLAKYFDMPSDSDCSAGKKSEMLAKITGWQREQICALIKYYGDGTSIYDRVAGVNKLKGSFDLSNNLGVDVQFFEKLLFLRDLPATGDSVVSGALVPNWEIYHNTARTVIETVNAKYDDKTWAEISTKIDEKNNQLKRDALAGIVLWKLHQKYQDIRSMRQLYEFFLIDVEMSGCAQISRIKEAINAVSLYMQRVRLNLELGIKILDIPEVWWEWLLNYRVWEANRKIFLYPENYLDPRLRRSKTSIFKTMEDELLQNEITKDSVANAYKNYLEEFSTLAKLKYVDAYYCTVSYPGKSARNTLFLFSRTETEPYTYFYCSREDNQLWSEWKQITQTINSRYITPVFAFSRLFLFWVEIHRTTNSTIDTTGQSSQSKNSTVYKSTVNYTFYNFTGGWTQPQILCEDEIIFFTPDQDYLKKFKYSDGTTPFIDLFNIEDSFWQKVYALKVEPKDYTSNPENTAKAEKISLIYGPFLKNSAKEGKLELPDRPIPDPNNPDKFIFEEKIYQQAENYNRIVESNIPAYLSINRAITLNTELQDDFLIRFNEMLVLENLPSQKNPLIFRPEIDTSDSTLNIIGSDNAIFANYFGDYNPKVSEAVQPTKAEKSSFITADIDQATSQQIYDDLVSYDLINENGYVSPLISQVILSTGLKFLLGGKLTQQQLNEVISKIFQLLGSPQLLATIARTNSKTVMVKNQPDWFIFDNGDEAFIFAPKNEFINQITSLLQVSSAVPVEQPTSFISAIISTDISKQIYQGLFDYGVIDANGEVSPLAPEIIKSTGLKFLLGGKLDEAQRDEVAYNLLNRPIIYRTTFITGDINKDLSEQIYQSLFEYGLVDNNGRVSPLLKEVIKSTGLRFLVGGALTKRQLTEVIVILLNLPTATSLVYGQPPPQAPISVPLTNIHEINFDTTRITTGAINQLSRKLFTGGIDRLLSLSSQQIPVVPILPFDRFKPSVNIIPPTIADGAQVDFNGTYGRYYREVFFQTPFLVAVSLNSNQKFAEAQQWYQYIFNPTMREEFIHPDSFITINIDATDSQEAYNELLTNKVIDAQGRVSKDFNADTNLDFLFPNEHDKELRALRINEVRNVLLNYYLAKSTSRYWQYQPFRNQTLPTLKEILTDQRAITAYNDDPFDPFAIADLRIGSYEKAIVMRYIDNLLQWGDYLFSQYTWESITTATMLYVFAYDLLGSRPENLGSCKLNQPATFAEIKEKYKHDPGGIPQFLIDLESMIAQWNVPLRGVDLSGKPFNDLESLFCVPDNSQLIQYWDHVEDRLFKIRHCLTIAGVKQQLALFEPPIDPMLLVRAAAGGGMLDVMSQLQPVIPNYRFNYMIQQAKSLTNTLIQLGNSLLSALEKKDAEELSMLKTVQEEAILKLTTTIKQQQIEETTATLASLKASAQSAQIRYDYFFNLLKNGLSAYEDTNLDAMATGLAFNIAATISKTAASIAYSIPQVGSPFAITYGGVQIGNMIDAASAVFEIGSTISSFIAQRSLTMAGYERRSQEWQYQIDIAQAEITQVDNQIKANQFLLAINKQDLVINQKSIEQTRDIEFFLQNKFSNEQLYQWMVGRLCTLYFQTYKIALEIALAAQSAYQYELNRDDTFITFNYWDSLKKGLLSGESLMLSLDQLEQAYINKNARRFEIEKTISLLQLNPEQLMKLKSQGECEFIFDEKLFDYDFPGQYCRQIKSITISVPALIGPYQNIKATLTQTSNSLVFKPDPKAVEYLIKPNGNPVPAGLRQNWLNNQQIAISRGVNDAGMFVLDFRDDRYLPFEGTGAVSSWKLSMPYQTNRIDFNSISDVIIKLSYSALQGGGTFPEDVEAILATSPYEGAKYINLNQAYSSNWFVFMNERDSTSKQTLRFNIGDNIILPNLPDAKLDAIYLKFDVATDVSMPATSEFMTLKFGPSFSKPIHLTNIYWKIDGLALPKPQFIGEWSIEVDLTKVPDPSKMLKDNFLNPKAFLNIELILSYSAVIFTAKR